MSNVHQFSHSLTHKHPLHLLAVDFLLDGAARDQAVHHHAARLADAVRPVHRLRIRRRVPAWIVDDDTIRSGQGQAESSHLTSARVHNALEKKRVTLKKSHQSKNK